MPWVNREYADELAVLATWLAVLLPWSVSYTTRAALSSHVAFFRFGLATIQIRAASEVSLGDISLDVERALAAQYSGTHVVSNVYLDLPPLAATYYTDRIALAEWVATAGLVVLAVAFALSLAMYVREEATAAALPVPYIRVAGALLGLAAVAHAGWLALVLTAEPSPPFGTPIPVGFVLVVALAAIMLRADRRIEREDAADPATSRGDTESSTAADPAGGDGT